MTIMHTQEAAMRALSDLPFPGNLAMAAAVVATGAARIATISSTDPSGGGSVGGGGGALAGAGGGSGLSSAPLDTSIGDGDGNQPGFAGQSAITVVVEGDVIGWDEFSQTTLVDTLRDAVRDRDFILIDADSRNGQQLAGVGDV